MQIVFTDWKRNIGIVTLLMSCFLSIGWLRSLQHRESLYLSNSEVRNAVFSVDGKLGIFQVHLNSPESPYSWASIPFRSVYGRRSVDASDIFNVLPGTGNLFESRVHCCGFDIGRVRPISDPRSSPRPLIPFLFVPYWAIVSPLILLSAWLLLAPTRPRGTRSPEAIH